ncbi:hypothetical protein B2G69_08185 [Methylorubrum zatmanii]|nr:hypothetical protein [Methylorubrum zatmanii]ARO54127.1 hypothetical protein B2G69_08185 [Methylorubrum zatmanii]
MFEQLLASALGKAAESTTSALKKVDPDALLARLVLTAKLYAEPTPFRAGDLVTPRADGIAKGAGTPSIVIEVLSSGDPIPGIDDTPSWSAPIVLREPSTDVKATASNAYGRVLDLRVACLIDGSICTHVVESQDFEAWTPEHETAWHAKLAAAEAGPKPLSLTEAVAALRDRAAGKEVKAEWKKGDTVEIVAEPNGAEPPMSVEGLHVGIVRKVDPSDVTTHVTYHAASTGKIGNAWLRNADLAKWGPKPAPAAASVAPEPATA